MTATVPEIHARLSQHRRDGLTVLCPAGGLDRALVDEVRAAALAARSPVIVDLGNAVFVDPDALRRIVEWELYRPEMCVVCPRSASRQLLDRVGIDRHIAVYEDVAAAVEARGSGAAWPEGSR